MERRASQRKPIHLEATLSWKNKLSSPCVVEDFCAEGMFVKFGQELSHSIEQIASHEADNEIDVSFAIAGKTFQVSARPVRVMDGAVGLSFTRVSPGAIEALLEVCAAEGNDARLGSDNSTAAFVLRQFVKALERHLTPLMDAFYEDVDKTMREAATQASSDQIANQIMDCCNLIQRRKPLLLQSFFEFLQEPVKSIRSQSKNISSDLAVIDKNEFEDWLTIKVMITKAETMYRGPLLQLKMRLDKVGVVNETGLQNPFGPALLCHACKQAARHVQMFKQSEKVYYKTFESSVLKKLDDLYQELNQILVRQNILPDLDLSKYVSGKKSTTESSTTTDEVVDRGETPGAKNLHSETNPPIGASASKGGANAGTASRGIARSKDAVRGQGERSSIPLPDVEETDVATQGDARFVPKGMVRPDVSKPAPVKEWQGHSKEDAVRAMRPPFSSEGVAEALSARDAYVLNHQSAQQTFKTVQNLFATLERSRQGGGAGKSIAELSDKPKWSLSDLQKSLQKLQELSLARASSEERPSLSEQVSAEIASENSNKVLSKEQSESLDVVDRFFVSLTESSKISDEAKVQLEQLQVPVLKMLLKDPQFFEDKSSPVRGVINRVAQLGVKGGRASPAQMNKIDTLIERISKEFEQDTVVFDQVLTELDDLMDRQNLLYRRNVERVIAAAEGSAKLDDAKKAVSHEIEKRIAGRKIPKAVVSLINGGWRDLLSLTYIRQGPGSQRWIDYLSVLDTLVAYGSNPHMELNLAELLRIIQEGLSSISSNHMPSGHIRDELKRFIVGSKERPPEMIEMPPSSDEPQDSVLPGENRQRSLQRWVLRAQKLKIGDWIRYQKEDEEPKHMRLVWVGKGFSKFVFVNHQGMRVIELDLIKMATLLQKNVAVPEPDYEVPAVDEGLDHMVKKVYEQLSHRSTHDDITGLANRKEVERSINQFLDMGEKGNVRCTVIYLDLRQFRIVNDSAGYDAGDKLLEEVAGILRSFTPKVGVLGRMGGNEFALVMRTASAEPLAKHILETIREYKFEWDGKDFTVSLSLGLATASEYLTNAERLLQAAESACRTSKKLGVNRLYVYHPEQDNVTQQEQIVAKVAGFKDLNAERVLLRCQKIIPLKPVTAVGFQYEVLLSIYDDLGHLIPAREFVRTAELYNRMQTVDRWVVGHMLDWMAENPKTLDNMGGVCINLSGHSLNDEDLLEFIYDRMSQKNSPLERVCFEITEAAAISNLHDVADFMTEMKEMGCRFCLGSFGAGMSSYQYLKSLPVDLIKIDGSFTKDLARNEAERAMVNSMTEMVHFMGREVIASQVEDVASLEILRSMGVDYAQGYCIEKPRLISSF